MQEKLSKKAVRRDETRAALLAAARKLFGENGFAQTGTEEIVASAKVTRGALYYHFKDKAALFEAVVENVAADLLAEIERAAESYATKLDGLVAGCRVYLDFCVSPEVRRIYVIDAPSVLGPGRLREIDARYAMGSLRQGIEEILAEHPVAQLAPDALTALLSGALDESVLWLVRNDDPFSRDRLDETLDTLIRRTFAG